MSRGMSSLKVCCYKLDGSLVRVYDNAKQASLFLRGHPRTIDKCLRENKPTALGYMWRRFPSNKIQKKIEPYQRRETSNISKRIVLVDINGLVIKEYPSIRQASLELHLDPHSIRDVLSNKARQTKGYIFRYTQESITKQGKKYFLMKKKVIQYSLDGKYLKMYPSVRQAALALHKSPQGIYDCLNHKYQSAYGYKWKEKK